jgi:hypothetical protein
MCAQIILAQFFLSKTPLVLMLVKHSCVTRTKCLIAMYKVSKNDFLRNQGLFIEHTHNE